MANSSPPMRASLHRRGDSTERRRRATSLSAMSPAVMAHLVIDLLEVVKVDGKQRAALDAWTCQMSSSVEEAETRDCTCQRIDIGLPLDHAERRHALGRVLDRAFDVQRVALADRARTRHSP